MEGAKREREPVLSERNAPGSSREVGRENPRPGEGKTVLFLDSNAVIRNVARAVLEKAGYRVVPASGIAEGITAAERMAIDVAVCDIDWPGLDGLEVFDALRRLRPRLPFVLIGAARLDSDYLAAVEGEGINFVAKPFSARQILIGIERQLRRNGKRIAS